MRIKLKVEAPIRAGGKEQRINKLEFVRYDGRIHAVSPRKLARLLQSKSERTLDDWYTWVLTGGQSADLTTFLEERGLLDAGSVQEMSRYSAPCEPRNVVREFLLPHARDARGKLFIPGSAIKGAIRAAVMWALVDEDRANEYVRTTFEGIDRFAQRLEEDVLQSYDLPHSGGTAAHHDFLRCVKVADGYGELESRVEKIIIQSYTVYHDRRTTTEKARGAIFAECLTPGSWAEFDLKVDKKILCDFKQENEEIPFEDEASLLKLVREFYEEIWGFERRYYGVEVGGEDVPEDDAASGVKSFEEWLWTEKQKKVNDIGRRSKARKMLEAEYRRFYNLFDTPDPLAQPGELEENETVRGVEDREVNVGGIRNFYSESSPGFRLGWGSGLMSTTVDMRLNEENRAEVLEMISQSHYRNVPSTDGPKSRKLVGSDGVARWPMGWANLEVVG